MIKKSVILLFLLFVACAPRTTEQPQNTNFRSGSQGLVMSFVPNLPPPRLFDRDPFNVMINVQNAGASPVGNGLDRIYISGFDHNIITGIGTDGESIPFLEGKTQYMPQGTSDVVSFKGIIRALTEKRTDRYNPLILTTACYSYETIASPQVCIDPDPYSATSVQKVCTPGTVGTGSQGAPIAVSSVRVEPSPSRTRFVINIQNVGGGNVFKYGTQYLAKCSPYNRGLAFDEIDYVQVSDILISGRSIKI